MAWENTFLGEPETNYMLSEIKNINILYHQDGVNIRTVTYLKRYLQKHLRWTLQKMSKKFAVSENQCD